MRANFFLENGYCVLPQSDFIVNNFGFGDFIFRYHKGKEISRANDLKKFKLLYTGPHHKMAIYEVLTN